MSYRTFTPTELLAAAEAAVAFTSKETSELLDVVRNELNHGNMVSVKNLELLAKQRAVQDTAGKLHDLLIIPQTSNVAHLTDKVLVDYILLTFSSSIDTMVFMPLFNQTGVSRIVHDTTVEAMTNVIKFFSEANEETLMFTF